MMKTSMYTPNHGHDITAHLLESIVVSVSIDRLLIALICIDLHILDE